VLRRSMMRWGPPRVAAGGCGIRLTHGGNGRLNVAAVCGRDVSIDRS